MQASPRPSNARGFALIAVLWLLALLTIMATTLIAVTRNAGRFSQRAFEIIQAEALADSGIRIALTEIALDGGAKPKWVHGTSKALELWEATVSVSVENEAGRIDLNAASEQLLTAYLSEAHFKGFDGDELARQIALKREVREPQRQYDSGVIPSPPPFRIVEEIRQLQDAREMSRTVLDGLTVYTGAVAPRRTVASPSVVTAIDSVNTNYGVEDGTNSAGGDQSEPFRFRAGDVIRVHGCADAGKVRLCREVVSRLTGNRDRPLQVFLWKTL